ncbi:MAG TPA: Hsp20/alpha crystallin family protein [Bacteroidales bacterium]|nr:Hsp20/alpha crystallin family protein [Bacteroidales bacterium]
MTRLSTYRPTRTREYNSENISRLFNRFFNEEADCNQYFANPPANIVENEKDFRIEMAVPGYTKSDFNIELDENRLVISLDKQEKDDQASGYLMKEFGFNTFSRSFRLSNKVDQENISAQYENGMLLITVPKKKEMMHRSIEIS